MVYFTDIKKTDHYIKEHERNVPFSKVVEIIFSTKNPKKVKDKFEISKDGYYILFEIKDNTLYIINAKKL
ncbi:MAG: hypothetical protein V1663_05765 [archaeon]